MNQQSPGVLHKIFGRVSKMPVAQAVDGEKIEPGRVYVARPDHHLIIERERVRVTLGPKENRHRPAVDPLFRSAAVAYGSRVIGVILSGNLDDGTAGLLAVKKRNGIAVVQNPDDALYNGMPNNALNNVAVDYCMLSADIGPLLLRLVYEPDAPAEFESVSQTLEIEAKIASLGLDPMEQKDKFGKPSFFTCPECHGILLELHDDELMRFRCQVGHAFSSDSLQAEQDVALETALWVALRSMQENEDLANRMAQRARIQNRHKMANKMAEKAEKLKEHAEIIRNFLLKEPVPQTNEP